MYNVTIRIYSFFIVWSCFPSGEPMIDGEVVPYDEKYHEDWVRYQSDDMCRSRTRLRKAR